MINIQLVKVAQSNMSSNIYDVSTNHEKVLDFVEEVVQNTREWGTINVYPNEKANWFSDKIASIEYKWGKKGELHFKDDIYKTKILDGTINTIKADGGWSNMNYNIYLKED